MGDGDAGGKGVCGTVKTSAAAVSYEWGDDGVTDQDGKGRTGGNSGSLVGASGRAQPFLRGTGTGISGAAFVSV